jgi:hypothetical protein
MNNNLITDERLPLESHASRWSLSGKDGRFGDPSVTARLFPGKIFINSLGLMTAISQVLWAV